MNNVIGLERFILAQRDTFDVALAEIRRGRKRTHWMWWIFPQLAGLGRSPTAQLYAISSADEARAYVAHTVLGPRLAQCVEALQDLTESDAEIVFGPIDAMKLRSSLTLFEIAGGGPLFLAALDRWFHGQRDPATLLVLDKKL